MDLKVLGCHGGETPRHRTTSFLVNDRLAIDAGAITSALGLEGQRSIEAVLVSHAHIDHIRDLATLADNRCQLGGPPLEIVGTPETLSSLRKHFFNDVIWPDFTRIPAGDGPTVIYRPVAPEASVEVASVKVKPVLVNHTIETAGFIVEGSDGTIAYSGDTGPTERLWELLAETPDLRAVLLEVSFPNAQAKLAESSGHHTPASLAAEVQKLPRHRDLPFLLYHIKPVFQAEVERELARLHLDHLVVLDLEDELKL